MWNSIRFGNTIRETTPQWELLVQTGVAVEKLLSAKFAKTKLRQDALQTTLLVF